MAARMRESASGAHAGRAMWALVASVSSPCRHDGHRELVVFLVHQLGAASSVQCHLPGGVPQQVRMPPSHATARCHSSTTCRQRRVYWTCCSLICMHAWACTLYCARLLPISPLAAAGPATAGATGRWPLCPQTSKLPLVGSASFPSSASGALHMSLSCLQGLLTGPHDLAALLL